MKVALVTYALNIGGMETFLLGLAHGLRKVGFDVTIIVTEYIGLWHDRPRDDGIKVLALLPLRWKSSRDHALKVADTLKTFDVVIFNHSRAGQSAAGLLPDSSVVFSILHNNINKIYDVGLKNLTNIDKVIAVSEKCREQAILHGADMNMSLTIRNGVDIITEFPKNVQIPAPSTPLKVVSIGRIAHEQKGICYLPEILKIIKSQGVQVHLNIIGDGPDLDNLRRLVDKASVSEMVTFHGSLPHEMAMQILQSNDVFIMPSHFEGQPITLFEAMARGIVPVTSNLQGITDTVITNEADGFLVNVGDVIEFAQALIRLATDREQLQKMSRIAWSKACDQFSIDTMTQKYVNLIASCLQERRQGKAKKRTRLLDMELLGKYPDLPLILKYAHRRISSIFKESAEDIG